MSEELKPCPFCGHQVEIADIDNHINDNGVWHVECVNCLVSIDRMYLLGIYTKGDKGPMRAEVIRAWNTRAELSALKAGQGEAVAWANWKVGTKSYVPYRTKAEAERCVRQSEIAATQQGPYQVVGLYTAPQPAQDVSGLVEALEEMIAWANAKPGTYPSGYPGAKVADALTAYRAKEQAQGGEA